MKRNTFFGAGLLGSLLLLLSAVAGSAQVSRMDRAVDDVVGALSGLTDIISLIETVEDVDRYRNDISDVGRRLAEMQKKYADLDDRSVEDLNEDHPELQKAFDDMIKAMIDLGVKSPEAAEKFGELLEKAMPDDGSEEEEIED